MKNIPREHYHGPVGTSPFLYAGYACNNNCIFCFERDLVFFKKTAAELKKEIKAIRKRYNFLNVMGQEPTLRQDLPELLEYASGLGFSQLGLTTNGRMLSYPDYAGKLLASGLDQVVITVAGHNAKMHDRHTQVKGSFTQTLVGIKNVLSAKGAGLVLNIMVTRLNFRELEKMAAFFFKLGVREMNIGHILPFNATIKESKEIVAKMSEVVPHLITVQKKIGSQAKLLFVEYPPCVFRKEYRHLAFPCLEENSTKKRLDLCKKCSHKKKCAGIPEAYINLYGTAEFKL